MTFINSLPQITSAALAASLQVCERKRKENLNFSVVIKTNHGKVEYNVVLAF
jgi:hypothetical protein